MATTIDYALIAGASYISTRTDKNWFPAPQDWTERTEFRRNDFNSGFEAVTFQKGSEIVISYAGTNPNSLLDPDNAANVGLATGLGSEQLLQAAEYYLQVRAVNPKANITLTGHSLGGGLAALIGVFFGVSAVTFNQAPFANSAELSIMPPDVAAELYADLLASGHTEADLSALTNFLQLREANGGIPNSQLVSNIRVDGEITSVAPIGLYDPIGTPATVLQHGPHDSAVDLHSQSLLTAFLQSMQTAAPQRALNDVTYKLTDLLQMLFDENLYEHPTNNPNNENILERLVRHEAGVRDPITGVTTTAADAMVTRFTSDLWKLAQESGLTMTDNLPGGIFSSPPNNVSKALIAFAMQMYYANTANAVNRDKELFTDLAAENTGSGGIRFDRADVADSLEKAKGYTLYFREYLNSDSFTDTERGLIKALLPSVREWYVQAGPNGMTAMDTFNHGAFLLGGSVADTMTGGSGADLLVGNAGNDILNGGAGNDTLVGGADFDTYFYNTGEGLDTILDRDGQGRILYDGVLLTGGQVYGDQRVHRDDAGHLYVDVGLGLSVGGTLLVEGYQAGDLGLSLSGTPVTPPVPILSLYGDLAPFDTDPVTPGVQWQYDSLGNIIPDPNSPEPGRADRLNGSGGNDLLAGRGGGDILAGWAGDDILYADTSLSVADAIALGNTQAGSGLKGDWLAGGIGDDTLVGSAGHDVITGGEGRDLLIGGAGNDELLGDRDWVATSFDWTVTDLGNWTHWYEPMNEFPDGNAADVLYAGAGNDFAAGGGGDDVLFGESGDDVLGGQSGNDLLLGGDGNDALFGGAGHDLLVGGWRADRLEGGPGDDRYLFQRGDGTDIVIDNLVEHNVFQFGTGISADDIILRLGSLLLDMGQGDAVHIEGFNQYDVFNSSSIERFEFADGTVLTLADLLARGFDLDGTALADTLNGTNTTDRIRGFGGADVLWGHEGDDTLDGGDGDDRLDGGIGADHLIGGVGHDTYVVDNAGDTITEQLNEGVERVHASINYALGANIEHLTLTGTGALTGTGNDLNNEISGNVADNILVGYAGNDVLYGGDGNDTLAGGWDNDSLTGGTGQDTYSFDAGDGTDTIVDNAGEGNRLVFGAGIMVDDVTIEISGDTLILHTGGANDQVQIQNFNPLVTTGSKPVESFEFADGTVLTYAELAQRGFTIYAPSGGGTVYGSDFNDTIIGSPLRDEISGGDGNDTLFGGDGSDWLWGDSGYDRLFGGAGNDYVDGRGGGDYFEGGSGTDYLIGYMSNGNADMGGGNTYVFRRGDGQDIIANYDPYHAGVDTLIFPDLLPTDLTVREEPFIDGYPFWIPDNLVFSVNGSEDQLALGYWIEQDDSDLPYDPVFEMDRIQFADGTVWTTADLIAHAQGVTRVGSDGDESFYGSVFNDVLQGAGGNDSLDGGKGNDVLDGGAGNDGLAGGYGNDGLDGGAGDDWLDGGYGSDTYVFGVGSGTDWISEWDSWWGAPQSTDVDVIQLGAEVTPESVALHADLNNNLVLTIVGTTDELTIFNYWGDENREIEQIVFADGTVWDSTAIRTQATGMEITGTEGDDVLTGTLLGDVLMGLGEADVLDGVEGNDLLIGGAGDDTYLWSYDGTDSIQDTATADEPNHIQFWQGISASDLVLTAGSGTLTIGVDWSTDQMNLLGFDPTGLSGSLVVGRLDFLSGFSIPTAELLAGQYTDADDVIVGTAGADVLAGRAGQDDLSGGLGDDLLIGGAGDDTYRFSAGDGVEAIDDRSWEQNRLIFGPGITPEQLRLEVQGHVLTLRIGDTEDAVRIAGFEGAYAPLPIASFEFADGTVQTLGDLATKGFEIVGTDGNDRLVGTVLNDRLIGGRGDDDLLGDTGPDTYVFHLGDGHDTIVDWNWSNLPSEANTIQFGPGIVSADLTFLRDEGLEPGGEVWMQKADLLIQVGTNGDVLSLKYFLWGYKNVQTLAFADGTSIDITNILNTPIGTTASETITGTSGNDTIVGGGGSDMLYGGGGDDMIVAGAGGASTLSGGSGNDWLFGGSGQVTYVGGQGNDTMVGGSGGGTYIFSLGDGRDTIIITNYTSANSAGNAMQFAGGYDNNTLQLSLGSLAIHYGAMGDEVHIENFDPNDVFASPVIQQFIFTDRVLTYSELLALGFDIAGTDGADVLSGTNTTDRLLGLGGDDDLSSGDGTDTLTGGLGHDTVRGGAGDDTYVFNFGDGIDTVEDVAAPGEGNRIQFGVGISHTDLTFTRDDTARTLTIQVGGSGADQLVLTQFDPTGTNGSLGVGTLAFADGSTVSLVDLYPPNQAPTVAIPLADQTVPEDAPLSIQVPAATFADAGDELMYSASLADGTAVPSWLSFDPLTRTFTGMPDDAQVGSLDLRVTATDSGNLSVSEVFTLTVTNVNEAPTVAAPLADQIAVEDTTFSFTVLDSTFADVDHVHGDVVTYGASLVDGTALPTWLSFDPFTRTFSGTPVNSDVGVLNVAVTATDTGSLSVSDTFSLTVQNINDAPTVAAPIADQTGAEDEAFSFTIPVGTFADEDAIHGDTLTYRATLADGSSLPAWLSFNPLTRTFSGRPIPGSAGTVQLAVTATDTGTLSVSDQFALVLSGPLPKTFIGTAGNDVLIGARGDDTLLGLGGNDTLYGRAGHDWLDGGTGSDTLVGETGNDIYVVDATGDVVTELANEGVDTVRTSLTSYTLGANVENLTLTGGGTSLGVGNALNNTLLGDAGTNVLFGGDGGDVLIGGAGTDVLDGGAGADTLIGGIGSDVLVGGTGNDRYRFSRGDGQDVIRDKDTTAGNNDWLAFGATINPLDLVIERQANDLRLRIHGAGEDVLIDSWYSAGTTNRIETIGASNGQVLLSTQVDQLIQAMASFSQQTGLTWDQAIDQRPQDVQTVLAANGWQ